MNAKELILRKVNAGSKLAKCYLFLITMGFDINDIVSFMVSPVVSFIDRITESNIYQGYNLNINDAIDLLNGKIPYKFAKRFLSGRILETYKRGSVLKDLVKKAFKDNNFENLPNYGPQFVDFISYLKLIRSLMPEMNLDAKDDLAEFLLVLAGADEFSNFGRLLGINQGIKTTEDEFRDYLQFIEKIVKDREQALYLYDKEGENYKSKIQGTEYEDLVGNFNVRKWLDDDNYRELVKKYYGNILKVTIPIFDIINTIPQFRDSFKILNAVDIIDREISLKTRVKNLIYELYRESSNDKSSGADRWSDKFKKNLTHAIHAKFIQQFLYNSGYLLPYIGTQTIKETIDGQETTRVIKGAKLINLTFDEVEVPENGLLSFRSLSDLASFKYIFENLIIPKLRNGIYFTVENGLVVEKTDKILEIKSNKFIQGLIEGEDKDLPLYRMNVDMMNYELTAEGMSKMLNYVLGIQALKGIYMNGISLSDWFILYNLYVNHNNYGSNRMTTLFDSFIDDDGDFTDDKDKFLVIKKYLNYIGELSYYGDAEYVGDNNIKITDKDGKSFVMNIKDLFMMSAVTVSGIFDYKDPVYRVMLDTGSVFIEKQEGDYIQIPNVYFSGDTQEKTVSRQNIIDSYVTVGGLNLEEKIYILKNLRDLNFNTILAINTLLADNFFEMFKNNCR